jgi:hypothetical protein
MEAGKGFFQTEKLPPLHLACGTDRLRENMMFIRFQNGWASCTNGHLVCIARTEQLFPSFHHELEGYFISSSGYKYIYDHLKKRPLAAQLTEEGLVITIDADHTHTVHIFTEYQMIERIQNGSHKFPNWETIWNSAAKNANNPDLFEHWIQINPKLVEQIHSIFGSPMNGMKIRPCGDMKPILVSANDTDWGQMFAILMPITKSQTQFEFIEVPNPTPIISEQTQ